MKDQKAGIEKTTTKSGKRKVLKRLGIVVVIIVALILGFWGVNEYRYQQRINALASEVNDVWIDVLKPAGGVEVGTQQVNCPHWISLLIFFSDTACPQVTRNWIVLVGANQESAFMKNLSQKEEAVEGNLRVSIDSSSNLNGAKSPYPAPTGKEWIRIFASASEYSSTMF